MSALNQESLNIVLCKLKEPNMVVLDSTFFSFVTQNLIIF